MTEEQKQNYQNSITQMERIILSFGEAHQAALRELEQSKIEYQKYLDEYTLYPMNQIPYIDFLIMGVVDRMQELELRINNFERGLNHRKMFLKKFKSNTGME